MGQQMSLLKIDHLSVVFGGLHALDDISIYIDEGEFVGLIGPNGAGKSTFFNCVTGYVPPTEGSIAMNGKTFRNMSPAKVSREGISRTFQNIRIFPRMSVSENVCVPMHSRPNYSIFTAMLGLPVVKRSRAQVEERANDLLNMLGLLEYRDRQAGTLAYGLQRRLEIARALATSPKLLLLDEPAAGMNNDEVNELMALLREIKAKYDLTIILIEHDIDMVLQLCPRIYVLNLGKILTDGTPEEIQNDPRVISAYLGNRRQQHG